MTRLILTVILLIIIHHSSAHVRKCTTTRDIAQSDGTASYGEAILSLIWPPGYCTANRCAGGNDVRFVVHTLRANAPDMECCTLKGWLNDAEQVHRRVVLDLFRRSREVADFWPDLRSNFTHFEEHLRAHASCAITHPRWHNEALDKYYIDAATHVSNVGYVSRLRRKKIIASSTRGYPRQRLDRALSEVLHGKRGRWLCDAISHTVIVGIDVCLYVPDDPTLDFEVIDCDMTNEAERADRCSDHEDVFFLNKILEQDVPPPHLVTHDEL
jgi:hypothetical protein